MSLGCLELVILGEVIFTRDMPFDVSVRLLATSGTDIRLAIVVLARISGMLFYLCDVRTLAYPTLKENLPMRRLIPTFVLVVTLSGSVIAGDIPSVDYVPPPLPPSAPAAVTEGDMGAGGFAEEITAEIVLAIFRIFAG